LPYYQIDENEIAKVFMQYFIITPHFSYEINIFKPSAEFGTYLDSNYEISNMFLTMPAIQDYAYYICEKIGYFLRK